MKKYVETLKVTNALYNEAQLEIMIELLDEIKALEVALNQEYDYDTERGLMSAISEFLEVYNAPDAFNDSEYTISVLLDLLSDKVNK